MIFILYHVLPLTIKVRGTETKFIFIEPEHDYLLMDTTKRYFTGLRVDEIRESKAINKVLKICKQTQPVQLTHLDEVCEAQMRESLLGLSPPLVPKELWTLTTRCGLN